MATTSTRETIEERLGRFGRRLVSPKEAVSGIRSGNRIFVGSACATPRTLIDALEARRDLADVHLYHFLTDGAVPERDGERKSRFQHRVYFVGSDVREMVRDGQADYIPISIFQVAGMLTQGRIAPDAAIIQVSMPDKNGYVSLGVSVDVTMAAAQRAMTIIAEVNPAMPRTMGDTHLSVRDIDHFTLVEQPVIEYAHRPADDVAEQIARYVARIIDNGSTIQVGLGQIPNEMLKYLDGRKDLGIHSDLVTDPLVDLIEKGIVTGRNKELHKDKVVASYCMGSERLYRLIDENPLFEFHPIEYVCDPSIIARNNKLVSVTQAFTIDLTGQVCSDQLDGEFYSGVSTQPEFLRGAASSRGGKPIICLRSTSQDGSESRIRPLLRQGEGATIPKSDVHYVITEYGVAYLFNRPVRERALALIEIAHPAFREELLEEGKRLGFIRPDQKLRSSVAYPEAEEREVELKNGEVVLIRPSVAGDVEALQNVFYSLSEEDVYTRFFSNLKSLSVSAAEHLCNVDYEQEMAFVAVAGGRRENHIVGSGCYYLNPTTKLAEVAYMIRPDWQKVGLGSALQRRLTEYAVSRGIRGFVAEMLKMNTKMINLAKSAKNTSIRSHGDSVEVVTLFSDK